MKKSAYTQESTTVVSYSPEWLAWVKQLHTTPKHVQLRESLAQRRTHEVSPRV